jgi:hypothetical protein
MTWQQSARRPTFEARCQASLRLRKRDLAEDHWHRKDHCGQWQSSAGKGTLQPGQCGFVELDSLLEAGGAAAADSGSSYDSSLSHHQLRVRDIMMSPINPGPGTLRLPTIHNRDTRTPDLRISSSGPGELVAEVRWAP